MNMKKIITSLLIVAMTVCCNMNPFQCEFYKTLEPGDETE